MLRRTPRVCFGALSQVHALTRVAQVARCGLPPSRKLGSSSAEGGSTASPPARTLWVHFRGDPVPYTAAWAWQQALLAQYTSAMAPTESVNEPCTPSDGMSVASRGGGVAAEGGSIASLPACTDLVLSLQHEHVYTLGRGAAASDLLFDPSCASAPAAVHRTERGGKITYHGPGQLVVYPILHLAHFRKDLHWYVSSIEQVVIDSLAEYGIAARRSKGNPGVWVGDDKVAQIGINCSKWVTQHGFAINVCPSMSYFCNIIPCGIADKGVTSVSQLLGRHVSVLDVEMHVQHHFSRIFGALLMPHDGQPLLQAADVAHAVQRLV